MDQPDPDPYFDWAFSGRFVAGEPAASGTRGFSLPEILLAMAISVLLSSLIWVNFQSQHGAYVAQTLTRAMQEDLRSTLTLITEDLRMAGYNPHPLPVQPAVQNGILLAGKDRVRVAMDLNRDGDAEDSNEDVTYLIKDSDGIPALERKASFSGQATFQPVINHVEALDFVYLDASGKVLDDDGRGNVTKTLDRIHSIQVLLAVRSQLKDRTYRYSSAIFNLQGQRILPAAKVPYRRAYLTETVYCRNLGLADHDARS